MHKKYVTEQTNSMQWQDVQSQLKLKKNGFQHGFKGFSSQLIWVGKLSHSLGADTKKDPVDFSLDL